MMKKETNGFRERKNKKAHERNIGRFITRKLAKNARISVFCEGARTYCRYNLFCALQTLSIHDDWLDNL